MYDNNLFAVDTTGVQEMGGYEVFPAGIYPAMMISAAKKPTKDNSAAYLECVYQIIEGEMTGKKFTSRLNLWNQNAQTVDIAKRELKSLRKALGLNDQESQTQAFLNRPVMLNITVKARKDDPAKAENNLVGIDAYGAAPAPAQGGMPFAQQPAAPASMMGGAQPGHHQQMQQAWPPHAAQPPHTPTPAPAFTPNAAQPPPWAAGAR